MTPDEIPQELIDILDRDTKIHRRTGPVVARLAEILTRWEQIRHRPAPPAIPPTDEAVQWWCTGCGAPRQIGVGCSACGWYSMQSLPKEKIDNG